MTKVKINVPTSDTSLGGGEISELAGSLLFEGSDLSDLKTMVKCIPAPVAASNVDTQAVVRLKVQNTTTRKGVVRLMVSVSMPYAAFFAADTATGTSNLKFSSARSGGEITMHTVLTLPKEWVADVVQQMAGSAGVESAFGQLQIVAGLHQLASLQNGLKVRAALLNADTSAADIVVGSDQLLTMSSSGPDLPVLQPTLNDTEQRSKRALTDIVARTLAGLSPIPEDAEIGMPPVN